MWFMPDKLRKLNDTQMMIIIFFCVIFSCLPIICDGHNWGGDFSQYLAQCRAISTNDISGWLEKQNFIITNSTPGFSPLIYPWITAIMFVPIYKIFGLNFIAFKICEIIFAAVAWIIFFKVLRLKENLLTAAIITAILFFNAHYIFLIDNILSECPFLLFSFAAIFFYYKREENFRLYSVLLGATIFFAVNTRTLGIALLAALLLDDISRRKFSVEKILPYATYAVLKIIFSQILPTIPIQNNSGYLVTFSLNPTDIFMQMIYQIIIFGSFFLPNTENIWSANLNVLTLCIGIFFILLAIIGAIKNFSEHRFLFLYCAITFAIISAFNTQAGIRYIFGIIPFAMYLAFLAIKNFKIKFLVIAILSATIFFSVGAIIFNPNSNQAYTAEAVETYDFINKNISDDKIIFFFKPRVLYLNTNNYSYFFWEDEENSLRNADYVLLTTDDYFPELRKNLVDNKKYLHVYGNEKFDLYKIEK